MQEFDIVYSFTPALRNAIASRDAVHIIKLLFVNTFFTTAIFVCVFIYATLCTARYATASPDSGEITLQDRDSGQEMSVTTTSGEDISITRYAASGKYLILWIAPEYGFRDGHRNMADKLRGQNIEVWQSNFLESLFLPQTSSSQKQLDGSIIADVIEHAHRKTGKKIIVAGDAYAAVSALHGAHSWQQRNHEQRYLIGAILFSPYTYAYIPALGLSPQFMPIVSATNIPIMIYQAGNSGTIGQFELLLDALRKNASPVYTQIVPDVITLFHKKEPTPAMLQNMRELPSSIRKMIAVLERHEVPARPVPLVKKNAKRNGLDISLKEYKGSVLPTALNLPDINGKHVTGKDYTGKITIVNFWASWCPPCVREIPLLNRLKQEMAGHPFELISVNFAEDRQDILDFMKKINMEFPVLLDSTGELTKKWNVITFPSTFVIDTEGKIRYGVNAAIEWDAPDSIQKIKSLL